MAKSAATTPQKLSVPSMYKEGPRVRQERPKEDLVTSLVIIQDACFLMMCKAMLGSMVKMMARNVLKTMLKEHVQY